MTPPPPSAPRRLTAALTGAVLAALALSAVRGGVPQRWGVFLRDEPGLLARDVLGFALGAVVAGVVAPLVAGDHVPGLPLRALAVSWVIASFLPPGFEGSAPSPRTFEIEGFAIGSVELLVLAAAICITTTVCWWIDTRITFPRMHPDPAARPPSKHTSRLDLVVLLVPHLLGVVAIVSLAAWGFERAKLGKLVLPSVMTSASIASAVMQRLRPARGSIWTALGVLGGLAGALLLTHGWASNGADYGWSGGRPVLLVLAGLTTWLALVTRDAMARRSTVGRRVAPRA